MISGGPLALMSYRVEWRANLTTLWVLAQSTDGHEEARNLAARHLAAHGGQVRIIVQHVIEARGLGA
jgi:hypothetical protein